MIHGFKKQTDRLTPYEANTLLPVIVPALSAKLGKKMAVTNRFIVKRLKQYNYIATEARIRKIINYIRLHDLIPCLIATSEGYYVASSKREIEEYEKSLQGREEAIKKVRYALQRQKNKLYGTIQ